MIEIIITGAIGLVTSVATGFTSWVFARKKYNSEVDSTLIENMQKSLEFYEHLSKDTREQLDSTLEDNNDLRKKVQELENENKDLKKELDLIKNQLLKLTTTICTDLSCQIRKVDYTTLKNSNNEKDKTS